MIEPGRRISAKSKKQKKFNFSRFIFYLLLAGFFGAVVYILFFSSFLAIFSIQINGSNYISQADILDVVKSRISGKFLGTIDKNNFFLIRSAKLEEDILEQFKIIRTTEIKKKFPSRLVVSISERTPKIVFCEKQCFILDENGEAYENFDASSDVLQKYDLFQLNDQSGRGINSGEAVLDPEYINYIISAGKGLLENLGLEIENNFRTLAIISNDIRVRTREGWDVYLNPQIEADKAVEILRAVLSEKIEKSQRADLEYVDLRIENKVFYKFRDGSPSEEARLAAKKALEESQAQAAVPVPDADDKKDKKKKE